MGIENRLQSIKEEQERTIVFLQNENANLQETLIKEKINSENRYKKYFNFCNETSVMIVKNLWKNDFSKTIDSKFKELIEKITAIQKKVNKYFEL